MQRFTVSLDDELGRQFGTLIAAKGQVNHSEAVRDLTHDRLGADPAGWCVVGVSDVCDHHEHTASDWTATSLHTHLPPLG